MDAPAYLPPVRAGSASSEADKPILRGWLHLVCFFLALPTAIWVILVASSAIARAAAVVYGLGLVALFGVSGSYHRGRWGPVWKPRLRRLDHSMIFVMIAGSYTPLCLVVLDGWVGIAMLIAVWTGAAVGVVLAWQPGRPRAIARNSLYILLGWAAVATGPQMVAGLDPTQLALMVGGGVLFTVGALSFAARWPNPAPRVFGYHEVWHVLVVAAVLCQLLAISSIVGSAPPA